jgi:hypothetical protein
MQRTTIRKFDIDKYIEWMRNQCKKFEGMTIEEASQKDIELYDSSSGEMRDIYFPPLGQWLNLETLIAEKTKETIEQIDNRAAYTSYPKDFWTREIEIRENDFTQAKYKEYYDSCVNVDYLPGGKIKDHTKSHFMWFVVTIKVCQYLYNQLEKCLVDNTPYNQSIKISNSLNKSDIVELIKAMIYAGDIEYNTEKEVFEAFSQFFSIDVTNFSGIAADMKKARTKGNPIVYLDRLKEGYLRYCNDLKPLPLTSKKRTRPKGR